MLDKLQKQICRTGGCVHLQNLVSWNLFYGYYYGKCSSDLAQLVPLSHSHGRSTHYSNRLHDFSVAIPRCFKDVYLSTVFFLAFLTQLDSGILCLHNAFLWPMIWKALSLELIDTFFFGLFLKKLSYILFIPFFFFL